MDDSKKILVFEGIEEIADFVVGEWKRISENAIDARNAFTVALSGGKTPAKLYQKISDPSNNLAWDNTHIFLADERFIPTNNADSNFFMIKQSMLDRINIKKTNLHNIRKRETAFISRDRYESDIKDFFALRNGQLPVFDLILLGIGGDGHTASLFSEYDVKKDRDKIAVVTKSKIFKYKRISLTMPVINRARHVMFAVTGRGKSGIIKRMFDTSDKLPASFVKPKKGELSFLLDRDAARLLRPKGWMK